MWAFIALSGFGGEGRGFLGFGVPDFPYGPVLALYNYVGQCLRRGDALTYRKITNFWVAKR